MKSVGVLLFFLTVVLSLMGIFILYESSSYTSLLQIGDRYFFVKRQIIFVTAGAILSLLISQINYKKLYKLSVPLLIATIILLLVVLIPGIGLELKGARRWIDLGFFVLQPSEILKVSLTLYLAAWLSKKEAKSLPAFLAIFGLTIGLVAIEPDMGTAVIIASASMVMYFVSKSPIKHFALIGLVAALGSLLLIKMEPYRLERISAFRNVDVQNLDETSYHIKQILIALGSGGITGVGFGQSIQKYAYLPENTTDSIFAIYAEEAGFLGSVVLVGLLFTQIVFGFYIAAKAKDMFARLLAVGITSFLCIQTLVNLGSMVVLIPLTGAPLPFISYGGSSMMINYVSVGILLAISRSSK